MKPRNRTAYERGQRYRAQIRELLAAQDPLSRPLTARQIASALNFQLSERTVQWHMAEIRNAR